MTATRDRVDMLIDAIDLVRKFHKANGLPVLERPAIPSSPGEVERIINGVRGETREFEEALRAGDLEQTGKELVDLLYVSLGAGLSLGLPLGDIFLQVHESNMTKDYVAPIEGVPQKPVKGAGFREANLDGLV